MQSQTLFHPKVDPRGPKDIREAWDEAMKLRSPSESRQSTLPGPPGPLDVAETAGVQDESNRGEEALAMLTTGLVSRFPDK